MHRPCWRGWEGPLAVGEPFFGSFSASLAPFRWQFSSIFGNFSGGLLNTYFTGVKNDREALNEFIVNPSLLDNLTVWLCHMNVQRCNIKDEVDGEGSTQYSAWLSLPYETAGIILHLDKEIRLAREVECCVQFATCFSFKSCLGSKTWQNQLIMCRQ